MPGTSSRPRAEPPIVYRDPKGRVWHASEIAQLRVVSPAIDGPNLCLVIRFERGGEERFAHWMGGESWRSQRSLDRLFGEAEGGLDLGGETGVGPAPVETVAVWINAVATMGPTSWPASRSEHSANGIRRRSATSAAPSSDDARSSVAIGA